MDRLWISIHSSPCSVDLLLPLQHQYNINTTWGNFRLFEGAERDEDPLKQMDTIGSIDDCLSPFHPE